MGWWKAGLYPLAYIGMAFVFRPSNARPGGQKRAWRQFRHRLSQIQAVALIHINWAARASLMDIGPQLAAVSKYAPDARRRTHFIRIIDQFSEVSLLLANMY